MLFPWKHNLCLLTPPKIAIYPPPPPPPRLSYGPPNIWLYGQSWENHKWQITFFQKYQPYNAADIQPFMEF